MLRWNRLLGSRGHGGIVMYEVIARGLVGD